MVHDQSLGSRVFNIFNYLFLFLFSMICFLPFVHIVAGSFASVEEVLQKRFILFPTTFSLDAYRYIFSTDIIFRSLIISILVTVVGTGFSMFLTSLMAYGLSRKDLDGRRVLMFLVVFTMLFSGGMIPTFLVVRSLGLLDTYWALIIPTAINAFNLIILKNFFQNIPESLEESAKIDGCNDVGIFFRIVFPLSMPAIATISLFYAVTYWNTFMQAILYLNDSSMWPIQVLLRQIVIMSSGMQGDLTELGAGFVMPPEQTIKMAVIVVATIPVLIVYPFIQKHFAKGALLGSVKG
ncbi:carbohydrate ABC transporter permease [Halalkalibacterium halodurans]|uniref:ABC transporter (Permiase) n=2 Tax=Halalkalibacterium halodurans TaxID=86665 RepID=Q9KFJ8_HALH5|nr:carbohydrate ABC transporter permease [Halalkalibacterium halodurans]BAB04200.1 ABC transporter (permiase) [Halalkalibacterium halodurans C-125]